MKGNALVFWRRVALVALLATLLLPMAGRDGTVSACWNTVLVECFDQPFGNWPWCNPPTSGRCWAQSPSPNQPSWGIQEVVYSTDWETRCSDDIQSIWCMGGPGQFDPDFDPYNRNLNTFVTYGPFDLSAATDALVQFQFLAETERFGDSLWWGASLTRNLSMNNIYIDSSFHGSTDDQFGVPWKWWTMDLGDLHDINGQPFSMLGQTQVYAFWWFQANSNFIVDQGAFIDNVQIKWDDGFIDMGTGGIASTDQDSVELADDPIVGDQIRQRFVWTTCEGGIEAYPPLRITVTVMDPLGFSEAILDTVVENVHTGSTFTWFTAPWTVELDGQHVIRVEIDPDNEIDEAREDNNVSTTSLWAWPPNPHPTFEWLAPSDDTLASPVAVMLRWEAYDEGETAVITIKMDTNNEGCFGQAIPGGNDIDEIDGEDSLEYSVVGLLPNAVRWPFARIADSEWDTCIYAPFPVMKSPTAADDPVSGIPAEFFLAQNYPNPFNPDTQIRFGLTQPGEVTLRVFDLLGREVALVVNENLAPGYHTRTFSGPDLPSGVYLYQLTSAEGVQTQKMVLLK